MIKKIFKIFAWLFGSLLMVVLFIIFLIGSGLLNEFIVRTVENFAGKEINGRLEIGSLKGEILSGLTLSDVKLFYGEDTLLKCDEISADYYLGNILKKKIEVGNISIKNMSVELKQDEDSVWNFARLIKPSAPDSVEVDTVPSDWIIQLNDLIIENFSAQISAIDTNALIPSSVQSNVNFKGIISPDSVSVKLKSFSLATTEPEFRIVDISGLFKKEDDFISWKNLNLKLNKSNATSDGAYSLNKKYFEYFNILFDSLAFDDFRDLLSGLKLFGSPIVTASLKGNEERYDFSFKLNEGDQSLIVDGNISDYTRSPVYSADISAQNLDASFWTHDGTMKSDVTGKMNISGKGFDIKTNNMTFEGEFGHLAYSGKDLRQLKLNFIKNKDNVKGYVKSATPFGNASLDYDLGNVFTDPSYNISGFIEHLNIDNLPGIDSLYSDLNINLDVKGIGIDPAKLTADLNLAVNNSSIIGVPIDDFDLKGRFSRGDYNFNLSDLTTPYFNLNSTGTGNLETNNDVRFSFNTTGMDTLLKIAGLPPVRISGEVGGRISGRPDSLDAIARSGSSGSR
jgi:hypothetical protein